MRSREARQTEENPRMQWHEVPTREEILLKAFTNHKLRRPIHNVVLERLLRTPKGSLPLTDMEEAINANEDTKRQWESIVKERRQELGKNLQLEGNERAMRLTALLEPLQELGIITTRHPKARFGEHFWHSVTGRFDKYLSKYPLDEQTVHLKVNRDEMDSAVKKARQVKSSKPTA